MRLMPALAMRGTLRVTGAGMISPNELERRWTGEEVADAALAEQLASQINAIAETKGVEIVLEVGRLLFDRCHAGDRGRVGPSATIDAVGAVAGLRMSRTGLYRAVQTWLQYQDLPLDLRDGLRLSVQYELLSLPAGHIEKERIAREAARAELGVAEVRAEVRRALDILPPASRPPPSKVPSAPPSLQRATQLLEPWNKRMTSGKRPTKREATGLERDLAGLKGLVARLEAWLVEPV